MTRPQPKSNPAARGRAPAKPVLPPWGPKAGMARAVEPRTLAGQTAQRLREDIVHSRLQPGERLTIDKLACRYGVGTSPLREALFQVAGDGLVRLEDHKGFVVAPLSEGEMHDVASLRACLEINALQRSIEHGGDEWEAEVVMAAHRLAKVDARMLEADSRDDPGALDEWEIRHRAFHYALCSACGSPWLLHFFDALYDQMERYRRTLWRYEDRVRDAGEEHERIRNAALARDADKAVALLKEHFRRQALMTSVPPTPSPVRARAARPGAASKGQRRDVGSTTAGGARRAK